MKSSEEMAKNVLLRLEQEKQQKKAKQEALRKAMARPVSILCCLAVLIGLLAWWQWPESIVFAFGEKQMESTPEVTPPQSEMPTSAATSAAPAETTEPAAQTNPPETAQPLQMAPEREYQSVAVQLVVEQGVVARYQVLVGEEESILQGMELAGMKLEKALPALLKPLAEVGYIAGGTGKVPVLMLAAYDKEGYDKNGRLADIAERDSLGDVISKTLAAKNITQRILERDQTDMEYVQMLEQQYGASTELFCRQLEQIRRERELSLQEDPDRIVVELFSMDIRKELVEPAYAIGSYDQYGEQILYGPAVEKPAPGWGQADIAPEIWETYVRIYTPEDLAMLMRPRIWTTMTNVVGMHEDEAGALLRSREIVPRAIYENNEEYRELGFTDGQVFMQEVEPGMRWNSDASVFIWVMATEIPEQEFNGLSQGWHPEEAAQPLDCIGEPEGN